MKILVIGNGGREHAIAWRLSREGHEIAGAPGNPGIAQLGPIFPTANSPVDYLAVAEAVKADLTVVGPEVALVAGVVDLFRSKGLAIVGPTQEMARLEASKIHSKEFMQRAGIPTARFVRTESEQLAIEALANFSFPVVIKADGLAAGKGVIIAQSRGEAEAAVRSLGPRLVIEEFLVGEEVSFIVLCDGRDVVALDATQDHKQVSDGDTGPNTGGMGAYCDGRILTPAQIQQALDTVIAPTVAALNFTGFLYAGLMMTADGPKVLEFNVRLGDPETQPLMHRLDCDFADALMRSATGKLKGTTLRWKPEPSACVVLAAHGYPGQVRTGDLIHGLAGLESGNGLKSGNDASTPTNGRPQVFQAGTRMRTGAAEREIETSGGRVLGVTASGLDLASAIDNAYAAAGKIHFDGMHYRRDIGKKGLKRWSEGVKG